MCECVLTYLSFHFSRLNCIFHICRQISIVFLVFCSGSCYCVEAEKKPATYCIKFRVNLNGICVIYCSYFSFSTAMNRLYWRILTESAAQGNQTPISETKIKLLTLPNETEQCFFHCFQSFVFELEQINLSKYFDQLKWFRWIWIEIPCKPHSISFITALHGNFSYVLSFFLLLLHCANVDCNYHCIHLPCT